MIRFNPTFVVLDVYSISLFINSFSPPNLLFVNLDVLICFCSRCITAITNTTVIKDFLVRNNHFSEIKFFQTIFKILQVFALHQLLFIDDLPLSRFIIIIIILPIHSTNGIFKFLSKFLYNCVSKFL